MNQNAQPALHLLLQETLEDRPIQFKLKRFLGTEAATELEASDLALLKGCLEDTVEKEWVHRTILSVYLRHAAMWIQLNYPKTHEEWVLKCQSL